MDETAGKLTSGEPLGTDQLIEYLPALKEVAAAQLEKYAKDAAVLHRYRKGQTVCVEGEFGSTAYYIVSGLSAYPSRTRWRTFARSRDGGFSGGAWPG